MQSMSQRQHQNNFDRIHPPIHSILDALSFRLARLAAVNDHMGGSKLQAAHGLSLNEWRIIGLIHAVRPASIARIRKILLMDKGQLSRTIKRLSHRGLIITQPAAHDARIVELFLTPAGNELHDLALNYTAERNELVVETLTPEECREFMRILQKITVHKEALSELAEVLE